MGTGPPRARPREEPPSEPSLGAGCVSPSLSVSPRLQPAALWLTSALASAPGAEAGPGAEGRKREGRRAVRTLRGAAWLLDPKTTRPATPPVGRRVRTGGNGKGVWELYGGTCRQLSGPPGVAVERSRGAVEECRARDLDVWIERHSFQRLGQRIVCGLKGARNDAFCAAGAEIWGLAALLLVRQLTG